MNELYQESHNPKDTLCTGETACLEIGGMNRPVKLSVTESA